MTGRRPGKYDDVKGIFWNGTRSSSMSVSEGSRQRMAAPVADRARALTWNCVFQGIRVYRSDVFLRRARNANFRARHRLDEPAKLSFGMVASLQSPLPFPLKSQHPPDGTATIWLFAFRGRLRN